MIIQTTTLCWLAAAVLTVGGSFGVNYAQIQVNTSAIEHSENQNKERYDKIQDKLDSIEDFLRQNHEHSEESQN